MFALGGGVTAATTLGLAAALHKKSVHLQKRRGLKPPGLQLGFDAHGLSWVYAATL
jgi:hypothetical protein